MKSVFSLVALFLCGCCLQAQQKNVVSILRILDIGTGETETVKEFPFLIEAPNWTPDGKWLVYNSGGQLYRISGNFIGYRQIRRRTPYLSTAVSPIAVITIM